MTKDEYLKKMPEDMREYGESLLDNLSFLKSHMEELKKLPFIEVHPTIKTKQRQTIAAKQYHDYSQTYNNMLALLMKIMNYQNINAEDESGIEQEVSALVEFMSRPQTPDTE